MQGEKDERSRRLSRRAVAGLVCAVLSVGLLGASHAQQTTTTQYAYDAQGNLTQITDPRGLVTNQSFDALNRLKQVMQPPSPPTTTKFGFAK